MEGKCGFKIECRRYINNLQCASDIILDCWKCKWSASSNDERSTMKKKTLKCKDLMTAGTCC